MATILTGGTWQRVPPSSSLKQMTLVKILERGKGFILETRTDFVSRQGELLDIHGQAYEVEAVTWKPVEAYVVLLVNKTH